MKVPLSILVPVRNEEANLPGCLESVSWADQIFVVDSNSQDRTQAIAREHGAELVQFEFNGIWPKKKNWSLSSLPFRHDWVFILDADETLPPEAEEEIKGIVSSDAAINGYWINRRFMFLGQWLKHAYYPNWNLRLFRHRLGRYEQITSVATRSGDNEVHEHVIVQGATGRLKCEMNHFAFPTVDVFVEKHNRYSNWEACVAMEWQRGKGNGGERQSDGLIDQPKSEGLSLGLDCLFPAVKPKFERRSRGLDCLSPPSTLQNAEVGLRRLLKRFSHKLPCRPLLRFLYVYIVQAGFLDGRAGYYFARLHGFYEFLCVAKTYEVRAGLADRSDQSDRSDRSDRSDQAGVPKSTKNPCE